jgi:hypothetical protein
MNRYNPPEIFPNSKVVIALGDSFTQGVGAWTDSTYKKYNYKIDFGNLNSEQFKEMYENSWVSQLTKKYLTDYIPINLGKLGVGNRAASSELHLNPNIKFENIKEGFIIFMLSGLERFDFVNKEFRNSNFIAVWPQDPHEHVITPDMWKAYKKEMWSEKFGIAELILSIKNVETFAKAYGLKLILISAFDQRYNKDYFNNVLGKQHKELVESIPWQSFIYPRNMNSCINLLVELDGKPQDLAYGDFWPYYTALDRPSEYITNCAHPTLKGYSVITDEIYNFIKKYR